MADPVGTDAAGRPGAPPTAGGAVSGAVDTSVEGGASAEASAGAAAPSVATTYHAVDARATAAGSVDTFSGGNREWGVLSINYFGNDRDGWIWRVQGGGLYRYYQIGDPGSGSFLVDRGTVALRYMDAVEVEAGALWMFGLFPANRLAGGRFVVDLPYTQVEAFAGKSIATVWDLEGPRQEFGVGQAGVVLRNHSSWFGHQIGYRRDGLAGGEETANYLADRISVDPGTHHVHLSNGTLWEIESGAFEVKPGVTVEILPGRLSVGGAYGYTNLPPFYASIAEMGNYVAHRAELTGRIRVSENTTLSVGGQGGNRDAGAMVALYSPYAGGQLLYRTAVDDREDWSAGGSLFGRVPMGSRAAFEPSAALLYKVDKLSGREGVVLDGGGRFVVVPADGFEMSVDARYTSGLVAANPDEFRVMGVISIPLGGSSEEGRPAAVAEIGYGALYNEPSHRPVNAPRVWGPVMAEVAPEFSHETFFSDDSHEEFASCGTCHAPSGSFKTEVLTRAKEPCSECHEDPVADEKGLARLAAFDHVGDIRGRECNSCHIDMREVTKPTGGWGAIIKYIHEGEAVNGRRGWLGHGSRQDATCTTCHSGTAQFENHTVATCNECHSTTANRGAVAVQGHQESWKRSGLHGEEYKADSTSCTTCHDVAGGECMSCHQGTTGWGPTPAIARGLHNGNDGFIRFGADHGPRHGELARNSGGRACITCHTEKPSPGNPLPACGSCHN